MNGQIVLCKGVNDKKELERTIQDLTKYIPCMESVSVVPVGLSKYRDGLYPLESFTKEDAEETIDLIEMWQKKMYQEHGIHFIHASDEFYLLAERELPEEERYDGYIQLENGVGMLRLLENEVEEALKGKTDDGKRRRFPLRPENLHFLLFRNLLPRYRNVLKEEKFWYMRSAMISLVKRSQYLD